MNDGSFALTGLASRGGLSNWVFFFFPEGLVMIDVGLALALKAGVQAGVFGHIEGYGPMPGAAQGLPAWSTELRVKAKNVVEMKSEEIRSVHLRLRMMSHELFVIGADGVSKKFGVMDRKHAEATVELLQQHLGSRFELSKTPVFAFLERHARFLL